MSSESITLGPESDQWSYSPSAKCYDLSRGASKKVAMNTIRGKEVNSIHIDPDISALVVVDMQNFFLHLKCRDHPLGLKTVEPTVKVVEKCRELGIQVVWLNWGLEESDLDTLPAATRRSTPRSLIQPTGPMGSEYGTDLGDGRGRCLMAGSWNADIYEPLKQYVRSEDVHCAKNRLSGMWNEKQPLRTYLNASGKRTLLFTGVNSDRCVLGTLADAAYAGWDCVTVEDCCAATTTDAHEVCMANIELMHGFVVDSNSFCNAERIR